MNSMKRNISLLLVFMMVLGTAGYVPTAARAAENPSTGSNLMLQTTLANAQAQENVSVTGATYNLTLQPGSDESEMNFNWYSDTVAAAAIVQIAKKSDMTGDVFPASAASFTGTVGTSESGKGSNSVTAKGLEASTEYVYRVGDGTDFSQVYSFKTKDSSQFNFILAGDPQIGSSGNVEGDTNGWKNTVTQSLSRFTDTSFILSLGDQVETKTSEEDYTGFFSASELRSMPLVTLVGNHDNGSNFASHYNAPNESTTYGTTAAGGDYWFTYGKTLFMVLNTNNSSGQTHKDFISTAIAANTGKDIKWRVVLFHQSIYSSANHSVEDSIKNLRTQLYPIMDENKIDVVLSGHDHCYTRSYQMLNGEAQKGQQYDAQGRVINPTGTLYITADSASGSKYYDLQNQDSAYSSVHWQEKVPTYSNVQIDEHTFTINTYRVDTGAVIDTYSIYKDPNYSGGSQTNYAMLTKTITDQIGQDHANPVFVLDQEQYSADSWSKYAAAIADGIKMESNDKATQADVDQAQLAINLARAGLVNLNAGDFEPYIVTLQPGSDESQMNFNMTTDEGDANASVVLQIAKKKDMVDKFKFPDTALTIPGQLKAVSSSLFSISASTNGLEPSTEYAYRLGVGDRYTKVYTFSTKATDTYNALFMGDPQIGASGNVAGDSASWDNTVKQAMKRFPGTSFILSAGDQVDSSTSDQQYLGFFSAPELTGMPLVPVIGNHDNNALYQYVYNAPNESADYGKTDAGADNWFRYGKTLYMVLNANNTSAATHEAFIQQALDANQGKDIKWKIVLMHQSMYSSASHSVETSIQNLRNTLSPVMDKYDIDVVLAGHDHSYTRSYQMLGGEPQKDQTIDSQGRVVNPTGTLYMTVNSSTGSKYYDLQAAPETYSAVRQQLKTPTYSNVEVSDSTFTISTYRVDTGENVDTYTIYKGKEGDSGNTGGNNGNGGNTGNGGAGGNSGNAGNGGNTGNNGNNGNGVTIVNQGSTTTVTVNITAEADQASGKLTAKVSSEAAASLLDSAKKAEAEGKKAVVQIKVGAVSSQGSVDVVIPGDFFRKVAAETKAAVKVDAGIASTTLDANAVQSMNKNGATGDITVGIHHLDASALKGEAKRLLGNRPAFDLSVAIGSSKVASFSAGKANVSIPYVLQPGEDQNAIIAINFDDSTGAWHPVSGRYDAKTGTVMFKTSEFAKFGVAYNKVTFADVSAAVWYNQAVAFMAARSITTGTGDNVFSPKVTLTRGQFIVMLMRAYGINPDEQPADNFTDAGNTYYTGYLAAAKRLAIAEGVGSNLFAPGKAVSRQEMVTLAYHALNLLGEMPEATGGKKLADFADAGKVASWATEAMTRFVAAGGINGSGNQINPQGNTSRAEMSQFLYNLLSQESYQ